MNRRTVLGTVGTALAGGLVPGCVGRVTGPGGDGAGDTPTDPGAPKVRFDVLNRECGQGANEARVRFGDPIRIQGTIVGSDTCDTAALAGTERTGDELVVSIEVTREEGTETPTCAQCITDIEYETRIDGADEVRTVVVEHGGSTVERAERP